MESQIIKSLDLHFILSLIKSHLYTKNYLQTYEQVLYKPFNWSLPSQALAMSHPLGITALLSWWWFCTVYRDNLAFPSLPQYRGDAIAGISVETLLIYPATKLLLLSVPHQQERTWPRYCVIWHHITSLLGWGREKGLTSGKDSNTFWWSKAWWGGEPIAHCSLSWALQWAFLHENNSLLFIIFCY